MTMSSKRIRVPMSHVDATWLGMDEPTNPMVINFIMSIDGRIEYDRLIETLNTRLIARFSRFSQRVVEGSTPVGRLYWERDPHFDIRSHVHHLALPDPGDDVELQRLIGTLMSEPLDRTRPLWRAYLIDNHAGGCALYGRIHHAVGDGISLMRVIFSMTDAEPVTPSTTAPALTAPASSDDQKTARIPQLVPSPARFVGQSAGALISAVRNRKTDPLAAQQSAREAVDMLKAGGLVAAAASANLARLALMAQDRESVYRGDLTPIKRCAWSQPLQLERVKQVGQTTGTTVNDVLVSVVSGGLRRYMAAVDGAAPTFDIRATIPVNLRPADAPVSLGNKFSIVFLTLPITSPDPLDRLQIVKQRMDAIKRSPEPLLTYEVLNVLGMLPGPLSRMTSRWLASKASCILTNVPGPRRPVYFQQERIDRMMFWVPQSRGVGLGISIFSYAGDVTIGVMADEALVPHPHCIVDEIEADFAELEQAATNA
jgi:diacylglycerol O-acyltransferase / wax synthase